MVVGWNPAPFLGEIPGLDHWIRSGSSASSLGRKKPWRNGCRAWGTTNCKRRRPGDGVMTGIFSMFFEAENMGNPDFMDFCKTKTDEKVESEAQTGGNGLDCRRLLYCIYVILCVYCKIYIFSQHDFYPLFPWIWWGLWVFHMGWRWVEHPPPVVDGAEVGMAWMEPWWSHDGMVKFDELLVELGILSA